MTKTIHTVLTEAIFCAVTNYDEPVADGSELDDLVWEESQVKAVAFMARLAAAGLSLCRDNEARYAGDLFTVDAEVWSPSAVDRILYARLTRKPLTAP